MKLLLLIIVCVGFVRQTDAQAFNRINYVRDLFVIKAYVPKDLRERKKIVKYGRDEIAISFEEVFKDTIITYINNQIYRKDFVRPDSHILGKSNVLFLVNRKKIQKIALSLLL